MDLPTTSVGINSAWSTGRNRIFISLIVVFSNLSGISCSKYFRFGQTSRKILKYLSFRLWRLPQYWTNTGRPSQLFPALIIFYPWFSKRLCHICKQFMLWRLIQYMNTFFRFSSSLEKQNLWGRLWKHENPFWSGTRDQKVFFPWTLKTSIQ